VPTFALSGEGVLFALLFALAVWLVFHALWRGLAFGGRRLSGRSQPASAAADLKTRRKAFR
jgi:hypothetical protein